MNRFRNHITSSFLWIILTVSLVNTSIDPADVASYSGHEDLTVNDIESIVELILEDVLGYVDSCMETDDADGDKTSPHPSVSISFSQDVLIVKSSFLFTSMISIGKPDRNAHVREPYLTISTPPPKFYLV